MSKTTLATVKVMLSYNYCHFEVSKQIEGDDISQSDIDNARKDCQRLADKAVGQYKTAKEEAVKSTVNSNELLQLKKEVEAIRIKSPLEWSYLEKAKVKALEDYSFQLKYNYMDDDDYNLSHL